MIRGYKQQLVSLRKAEERVDRQRRAGMPIALIVIDTLARHIASDADENSARDMGGFINVCDHLRDRYRAVTAIVHENATLDRAMQLLDQA